MVAVIAELEEPGAGGANIRRLALNLATDQGANGPWAPAVMLVDATGTAIGSGEPIAVYDGYQSPVTATWNSSTAVNTAIAVPTDGYDTVIVTGLPSGSITGGLVVFEVYDGVNWLPIKVPRVESYFTDSTVLLTGVGTHAWQAPVAGFSQFRARLSSALTGTGSLGVTLKASSAPDTSIVTVGVDPGQGAGRTRVNSAATTNATNVKASAGVVTALVIVNTAAAARFVKLYDKASAPTVGTDTPVMTVVIAATSQTILPLSIMGMAFTLGIGFAMTVNAADSDTTAVAAGDLLMTMLWN